MEFLQELDNDLSKGFSHPEIKVYSQSYTNDSHSSDELQRTDQWFTSRIGRVTGSVSKKLMSCTPYSNKLDWSRPEKVMDFGSGFYQTIYRMAMEMKHNTCFQSVDAIAFKYGRKVEPFIISQLEEKWDQLKHHECPSIDIIDGVLSASPDGKLVNLNNGHIAGFEAKAAMDLSTVYNRMEEDFNHKHQDFWQIQAEMLALETDVLIYATALPAKNIQKVLSLPNEELVTIEHIPEVIFKQVKKSETHCMALIERSRIAGNSRDLYLKYKEKVSIRECVEETISIINEDI